MTQHTTWVILAAGLATCGLASGPLGATTQEWPSFRGPSFDARAAAPSLAGLESPALVVDWRRSIGPGYSAVSIAGGRAITQFSDGTDEILIALAADDGRELWRQSLGPAFRGYDGAHDGPIATPAIHEDRVFAFTPRGLLHAVALADGKKLWTVDLGAEPEAQKPHYGYGSSPLVHRGRLWLEHTVKDRQLALALDPATGAPAIRVGQDIVGYHSPLVAKLAGREQVLVVGTTKLYGLDGESGKVLWEFAHEGDASAMGGETIVPLVIPDDRILLTPKNDTSALLALRAEGDTFKVETLWTSKSLGRSYSRPVYHDGHFYGYVGGFLTCIKAADGSQAWRSRPPGDGFLLLLDDHLVVLTKQGSLHLGKASPAGWQERAQLALFSDHAWTAPSFAQGKIYARSMGEIAAISWVDQTTQRTATAAATSPSHEGSGLSSGSNQHSLSSGSNQHSLLAAPALPADALPNRLRRALEAAAAQTPPADPGPVIDSFLGKDRDWPLIDGDWVHFFYRGTAQDLGIVGEMIGARVQAPLTRIAGTDLWFYSYRLAPAARVGYRFVQDFDNLIVDPRNPRREPIPGQGPNAPPAEQSWVAMPDWVAPAFLSHEPTSRGRLERQTWVDPANGDHKLPLDIYLPPGYDPKRGPYPVLYVHGATPALGVGKLDEVFDRLQGHTAPFLAVFVHPAEPRENPLNQDEALYGKTLAEQVVPWIDSLYPTTREAATRSSYGAGFGGTFALKTTFAHPQVFGQVAVQSAFFFEADLPGLLQTIPPANAGPHLRYLDWGRYDSRAEHEGWNVGKANAALAGELKSRGYTPAGGEFPEGASWYTWRARLDRILPLLFPSKP